MAKIESVELRNMRMIDRLKAVEKLKEISLGGVRQLDYSEAQFNGEQQLKQSPEKEKSEIIALARTLGFCDHEATPDDQKSLKQKAKTIKQEYELLKQQNDVFKGEYRKFEPININKPEIKR